MEVQKLRKYKGRPKSYPILWIADKKSLGVINEGQTKIKCTALFPLFTEEDSSMWQNLTKV